MLSSPARPPAPRPGTTPSRARVRAVAAACGLLLAPGLAACSDSGSSAEDAPPPAAASLSVPTYADGGEVAGVSSAPTGEPDGAGEETTGGESDPGPATSAAPAELVVTFWQWDDAAAVVDVSGYVSGTVESDGHCTLTMTRRGTVLTGSSQAYPDAATTSCSSVRVAVPPGSSGDWSAVLAFESPSTSAASAPFTVTVR